MDSPLPGLHVYDLHVIVIRSLHYNQKLVSLQSAL